MSKGKIITSAILAFIILYIIQVLYGNDIIIDLLSILGGIISVIILYFVASKQKEYKINYYILFFACIGWIVKCILVVIDSDYIKTTITTYTMYEKQIIGIKIFCDLLIAISCLMFLWHQQKAVYSFQFLWDNISILECTAGFIWIMFLKSHYKYLLNFDFITFVCFICICINITLLNTLFLIYLSSQDRELTIKHHLLLFGLAVNSTIDLYIAFSMQYSFNKVMTIAYMLSIVCLALGGLCENNKQFSSKKKLVSIEYNNVGEVKWSLFLLVAPIIIILNKGFNIYEVAYFLLVIFTYFFITMYVKNSTKVQFLLNKERESREKYELLAKAVEQSPVSIVITDLEGNIEFCNPHFTKLTGFSFEEVIGKNIIKYKINSEKYGDLLAAMKKGEAWSGEVLDEKKNGEKYYSEIIVEPMKNGMDKTTNYIFINEDRNELKEKEKKLREALLVAQDATKTKTMFLANISHEIRTPINAINGMAYLALKTELTEEQRDYISKISSAGTLLLGIINDILDFSKIESEKMKLEHVDFNLDEVVENVNNIITPIAYNKGINYKYYIHNDIPKNLVGDPLRIGQVMINLLSNAIKFTEQGMVSLEIIKINELEEKVQLQFKIKDTGIGILEEQKEELFEAFTQADGSTTRKYGGTGLGLAISKKLVKLMSGDIWVESKLGEGSTFIFSISLGISSNSFVNSFVSTETTNEASIDADENSIIKGINSKIHWEVGRAYIEKLKKLLIDSDSEAVDYFKAHRNILERCFEKDEFRFLEIALNEFNFDKALMTIMEKIIENDGYEG